MVNVKDCARFLAAALGGQAWHRGGQVGGTAFAHTSAFAGKASSGVPSASVASVCLSGLDFGSPRPLSLILCAFLWVSQHLC